jgi:hypothetical protein
MAGHETLALHRLHADWDAPLSAAPPGGRVALLFVPEVSFETIKPPNRSQTLRFYQESQ